MSRPDQAEISVLYVDDDADLAALVSLHLERVDDAFDVVTETSAQDGLDRLASADVDCVVSDLEMPGMDGLAFLEAVRDAHGDLPFVLFTGKGSEEVASDAIAAGVTEYLQKGVGTEQYEVLAHRIQRAVAERRARAEAAESERMFSTLVENLPGMVYRCRVAEGWPMEYVSEGCTALTGYEPSALEDGDVSWGQEIIHPADQDQVWDPVEVGIEAGESFELTYRIVTSADETRWVWERGSPVFEDGDLVALEGFISDVTSERRRQERLAEEQAVTEHALNALEDGFYVVEFETGDLLRWNDRVTEVTGYTDAELEDMTIFDLVPEAATDAVVAYGERAMRGEQSFLEVDIVCKDGSRVPIEVRGSRIVDEDGDVIGISGIARDVSDRRRSRDRVEAFARMVSHDIRNPLHVVHARTELAMETGDLDHLEHVASAATRLDALVEDLRTLALDGGTVEEPERVDLAGAARDAWHSLDATDAILRLEDPGTVEADPDRLETLLTHLFRNALEHGPGGGQSLTAAGTADRAGSGGRPDVTADDLSALVVTVGRHGDGFYVADDGVGVPDVEHDRVFENGYTTRDGGTGLGLPIVRHVARAHGWSVTLTESAGSGVRVELST